MLDPTNDQMEEFSFAYVAAVAATAGYKVEYKRKDTGIDLSIEDYADLHGGRMPQVEVQVKSTHQNYRRNGEIRYPLRLKNYNDLRSTLVMIQRLLVVVLVPEDVNEWLRQTEDELLLRRCGYCKSLRGAVETENETRVTVIIPTERQFSVEHLRALMSAVAEGRFMDESDH